MFVTFVHDVYEHVHDMLNTNMVTLLVGVCHDHGYKTAGSKMFLITDQFLPYKSPTKIYMFLKNLEFSLKIFTLKIPYKNPRFIF